MLVLKSCTLEEMIECISNSYQEVTEDELYHYFHNCYVVGFYDTKVERVVALGLAHSSGEVGLIVDLEAVRKQIRKFYLLLTVFITSVFNEIKTDTVYTGIVPEYKYLKWITWLGFTQTETRPAHDERGWRTFELPISRWIMS